MNERISKVTADLALNEIQNSVSRAAVCQRFAQLYNKERRNAQRYDKTDVPESELRGAALWNLYIGAVYDALAHVTKPEYVPVDEPDEEPTEG